MKAFMTSIIKGSLEGLMSYTVLYTALFTLYVLLYQKPLNNIPKLYVYYYIRSILFFGELFWKVFPRAMFALGVGMFVLFIFGAIHAAFNGEEE